MRIAVLADIHANMPALEAVDADLAQAGLDEILVGGDIVGRGPQGSAVTRFVLDRGWPCIRGNHEDYVLNFSRGTYPEKWATAPEWSAARWMGNELAPDAAAFLDTLPLTRTSSLCPNLRLVHGTPESYKKGLGDWTSAEKLTEAFAMVHEPLLVCAHTHRPFQATVNEGLIVNVGSVGMPFNGDWRAQYAIFSTEDGDNWSIEFRQVSYERDAIYEIYESSGFLEGGGITAQLLLIELQQARPFLVPFFKWLELAPENTPDRAGLDKFLAHYDPSQPLALFPELTKPGTTP